MSVMPVENNVQYSNNNNKFWGSDGFTFGDILDAVNPLRHIPIISSIYNKITGSEEISSGSRLLGGAIFGGVSGLIASFFDSAVEAQTGERIESHVLSLFEADKTQMASAAGKYRVVHELEWLDKDRTNIVI